MAFIIIDGDKRKIVPSAVGKHLWQIKTGEIEPDQAWARYASRVEKVYLNPYDPDVPVSYIERQSPDPWNVQPVHYAP